MNSGTNMLLLLGLAFSSCNNAADTSLKPEQNSAPRPASDSVKKVLASYAIPSDPDMKFEAFLQSFNKDSIFQASRIGFPLKIKVADPSMNYDLKEQVVKRGGLRKLDFTYDENKLNKEYEQRITVKKDKAVIEISGFENGIFAEYYFEKINGKWILVTWVDSST